MKSIFITFGFLFIYHIFFAQLPADQQKAILLKRMIELKHYSPRQVNDSFSLSVFKMIINSADNERLLFTASDYKQLSAFSDKLDDELNGKGWSFLDLFSSLYKKSLLRADTIINKIMQRPFDFSAADSITLSKDENYVFAADYTALTNRWLRYLKYESLNNIYDEANDDSTKNVDFKTTIASMESSVREKIKQSESKWVNKILNYPGGYNFLIKEIYFNAIASAFDKHTEYFSPQEEEKFQSELSTEEYSFGLDLDESKNGKIVVERLVPGGPAWKSGELHKGDELISLQWESKDAVDISSASVEEAEDILNQSNHDRLILKFRKADGVVKTVMMRKEKIENDENIVKSFLLKGNKKIGYIVLPGFYTEWENESGSSCANDVAKEIVKLKKENIDGLILDLRYNGGGSLGEALEMAGIFIDIGPLAMEKNKEGKQLTLKDPNRGTIYDGPLVVMVNGQSASASELMAAALQDYNRAVIAGSNTYGKATMQQMFSLDTISNKAEPSPGKETVKITTGKLYRLSGQTAQLKGVVPDIVLPDMFDGLEFREKFSDNVLPSDTVKRNPYFTALPSLPVKELAKRSEDRLKKDSNFIFIKKIEDALFASNQKKERTIPLKWDQFEKWKKQREAFLENLEGVTESAATQFVADNHQADKQWMQNNEYAKEVNDVWLKKINHDIYIREVFEVLCDLINLQHPQTKN